MVIDCSALVAIFEREPNASAFDDLIRGA